MIAGIISAGIDGFYTQLFFGLVIIISLVFQTIISKRMRS
jgi:simple sugar transport system permease protein